MPQTMQWAHLYSDARPGDASDKTPNSDTLRTSFIRDYDRIIFSSAFRRLQNKTQVFPLPGPAFVHNRLTHSLEVASAGRTLGKAIGQQIANRHNLTPAGLAFYNYELGSVISAACLAHDIGNPPFGHSGEDAIRYYFNDLGDDMQRRLKDNMSPNQWADFSRFEGNSNAFRVLTHHFNEASSAYNITQTTLASIVKYPSTSLEGFDKTTGLISTKKSGFFDSERNTWRSVATQLGLPRIEGFEEVYARHPFVFLTEAADDICYRIIDMEDAHRLGVISYKQIAELFLPFFDDDKNAYNAVDKVQKKLDGFIDPNRKVEYLRAVWIGRMIDLCKEAFIHQESQILSGQLQCSLLDILPERYASLLETIDQQSYQYIYNQKSVVEIEIAGFHVIGKLLEIFVEALLASGNAKSGKVLQLIPAQFPIDKEKGSLYHNLQSITDYISGMTDLYAIDLFRKITGITIKEL